MNLQEELLSKKRTKKHLLGLIIASLVPPLCSSIISFVTPIFFNKEFYSAYREYTLYLIFVGIFHLGIAETIITGYNNGKDKINDSSKSFTALVFIQLLFSFLILISFFFIKQIWYTPLFYGIISIPVFNIYYSIQVWYQNNKDNKSLSYNIISFPLLSILSLTICQVFSLDFKFFISCLIFSYFLICIHFIMKNYNIIFKKITINDCIIIIKHGFKILLLMLFFNLSFESIRISLLSNDLKSDFANWSLYMSIVGIGLLLATSVNRIITPYYKDDVYKDQIRVLNKLIYSLSTIAMIILNLLYPIFERLYPDYFESRFNYIIAVSTLPVLMIIKSLLISELKFKTINFNLYFKTLIPFIIILIYTIIAEDSKYIYFIYSVSLTTYILLSNYKEKLKYFLLQNFYLFTMLFFSDFYFQELSIIFLLIFIFLFKNDLYNGFSLFIFKLRNKRL